ncbi:MAG: CpsD/CapB family tyrosine-protein kinase [Acutalibacteraceae bacterium]|nr:CpsD/CapB family tyrosine-protein kinase [Acutalibacteraceae bacterium]
MSTGKHNKKPVLKELYSILHKRAPKNYVAAYKMLASSIEFITVAQKCKNIMITSSIANEGKTNCCVNLALALAEAGKSVCLVECDLRKPSLHRFVNSKRNAVGLTHVLKKEVELEAAISRVNNTSMSILLAGMVPPNPTELLESTKMKELISELEEQYDYVIYDTPPAYVISDAAVLGKYMDATFLIVKHNYTEKKVTAKAKSNLENAGVKLLGVILTSYKDKETLTYSDYYSNSYYIDEDAE